MWATNGGQDQSLLRESRADLQQGGIDRESQLVSQRPTVAAVLGRSDQIPKGQALQVRGGSTSRE